MCRIIGEAAVLSAKSPNKSVGRDNAHGKWTIATIDIRHSKAGEPRHDKGHSVPDREAVVADAVRFRRQWVWMCWVFLNAAGIGPQIQAQYPFLACLRVSPL